MSEAQGDSRRISVMKGITWRCLATLTTYMIAWLWTGETETAGKIAAVEFFLKFAIYYGHERFWQWLPRQSAIWKQKFSKVKA
jgi:adenylylsulfate kinase